MYNVNTSANVKKNITLLNNISIILTNFAAQMFCVVKCININNNVEQKICSLLAVKKKDIINDKVRYMPTFVSYNAHLSLRLYFACKIQFRLVCTTFSR